MFNEIIISSDEDSLSLKGNQICAVTGSKHYVFELEEIKSIAIETSDDGPFAEDIRLVVVVGKDTVIFVPSGHRSYEPFLFDEIAKALPINKMNIVQASSCTENNTFILYERQRDNSAGLKIFQEDGTIKISGTINLGYIGTFKDLQIEIDDTLEEIREWDIVTEHLDENCSDDEIIEFLNQYFNDYIDKIKHNIENINGTFLLYAFTDMDSAEINFMLIDELFIEEKLRYGNEEDIAEIYNPVRDGLNTLSAYLEAPNDGSVPKGHLESLLRSFYPMFNFDCFIANIIPEYISLQDGGLTFQCSDNFDNEILCGAYGEMDEELSIQDWHNF